MILTIEIILLCAADYDITFVAIDNSTACANFCGSAEKAVQPHFL